jgi:hypothetical protein
MPRAYKRKTYKKTYKKTYRRKTYKKKVHGGMLSTLSNKATSELANRATQTIGNRALANKARGFGLDVTQDYLNHSKTYGEIQKNLENYANEIVGPKNLNKENINNNKNINLKSFSPEDNIHFPKKIYKTPYSFPKPIVLFQQNDFDM